MESGSKCIRISGVSTSAPGDQFAFGRPAETLPTPSRAPCLGARLATGQGAPIWGGWKGLTVDFW